MKYIKEFVEIKKEDIAIAGGKGANLGEMASNSFPVPNGVVLTSKAFEEYLEFNHIDPYSKKYLEDSMLLRKDIVSGSFPEDVEKEIVSFVNEKMEGPCAVRSSATAEDLSDASFAGQQETYLNVVGEKEVLSKIKECYASLYGKRAISYRKNKGYDKDKVFLAVVIQEMVNSDKSGVLFTQNPNGTGSEVIINASYGLGEAVVSGSVTPDEYVCDESGHIIRETIASKEIEIKYNQKGTGTLTLNVDEKRKSAKALTNSEIERLTILSKKIEKHYNHPCDIEWAIKGGNIYILQCRAITTINLSNKLTPWQEKLYNEESQKGIQNKKLSKLTKDSLIFMLEKTPTVYYPLDSDLSNRINEQKTRIFAENGIGLNADFCVNDLGIFHLPDGKKTLSLKAFRLIKLIKSYKDTAEIKRLGQSYERKTSRQVKELMSEDISSMNFEKLIGALNRCADQVADCAYGRFSYSLFPGVIIAKSIEKSLKKVDSKLSTYDILMGLSYETYMLNLDMEELALKVITTKGAANLLNENPSYDRFIGEYPQLKESFDLFLSKHGMKSSNNCYALESASLIEEPDRVIYLLTPVVNAIILGKRTTSLEDGLAKYEELKKRLANSMSKKKWEKLYKQIEFYRFAHVYRESSQYMWETLFYRCRQIYNRLTKMIEKDGLILKNGSTEKFFGNNKSISTNSESVNVNDLHYLFLSELSRIKQDSMGYIIIPEELIEKIKQRKQIRPVAEKIYEDEKKYLLMLGKENDDENSLSGISGSSGFATGKACVILSPDEFYKMKKGCILVCHYTDPEWTPLFTLASAVVSDTGGALSHAAIVAREYGIPAVLGTGCATTFCNDGDEMAIDGNLGVVKKVS
ncbi:PEP/pyruvate-binding domain-containing protein [Butyrivibrio sp. NC3005]|uniref:PEP/pyruvate-binding domain-containing protein n=1 Tax=Butyrivibrio sp. NC3005 TaxID=1280685 RepID=UPI00041F6403|nr:PEP/pyruvate-binding domain-containing protein [Butyrivibrio sp. NC3005]